MLTRRLRRWAASASAAYYAWVLNEARRRLSDTGKDLLIVEPWARAQISAFVYQLNVERASARWAGGETEVSVDRWRQAMLSKGQARIPETEVKRWRWLVHGAPDDQ